MKVWVWCNICFINREFNPVEGHCTKVKCYWELIGIHLGNWLVNSVRTDMSHVGSWVMMLSLTHGMMTVSHINVFTQWQIAWETSVCHHLWFTTNICGRNSSWIKKGIGPCLLISRSAALYVQKGPFYFPPPSWPLGTRLWWPISQQPR